MQIYINYSIWTKKVKSQKDQKKQDINNSIHICFFFGQKSHKSLYLGKF